MSRARDRADGVLHNRTHEDTEGGRESLITFKGEQSGGEISTLAQIQASHDGTSDDEKADLIFKTNDGSDGASPTERMRIDSVGTVTITNNSNDTQLILESTDADANSSPVLELYRNSSSPADDDFLGEIEFHGENDADEKIQYGVIAAKIQDASDGTEDVRLSFKTITAGTERERVTIQPTEVVINEDSQDLDFRVESDDNANMLFVDAGNDRVGIGTASPSSALHVSAPANQEPLTLGVATNGYGYVTFQNATPADVAYLGLGGGGAVSAGDANDFAIRSQNNLIFASNGNNERMRVASNGYVGLGTSSPSYPLEVSLGQSDAAARFARGNTSSSFKNIMLFRSSSAGADVGSIQITNSATSYVTSSDHRLKENVETLSNGITRVKQLQPKRFSWIIDEEDSANQDGFLAHEAQTVVPEAVTGTHNEVDDDGNPVHQGIDQAKLVPLLTAALQEAIAKIETLETENTAIKARLDALEAE